LQSRHSSTWAIPPTPYLNLAFLSENQGWNLQEVSYWQFWYMVFWGYSVTFNTCI
jgi:hypothetical protein